MNIDDIRTVTVIGAGDMGHGIAEVALLTGSKVNLYDVKDEFVARGRDRIFASVAKLVEKGQVPAELDQAIRASRLRTTTDLGEAAADADLVIEAIPEVMSLKQAVFADLDRAAPAHALLASNTSTMSITEIASVTARPDKVLGLHYFNPAVLMRLVEVIRADGTSDATMRLGMEYVARQKKVGVYVKKDSPGFIANRVNQAPAVLLAQVVERGEAEPEALDAFIRLMGAAMGPCELTDYVGIDVMVNVSNYFAEKLHPDYGPAPHLVALFERGHLGKKSGQGYFEWRDGQRPEIDLKKATRGFNFLWPYMVQVNEASKLIQEGVVDTMNEVDLAMINGFGAPVGPITIGRQISKLDLIDGLNFLAERYGKEIFRPTHRVLEGGHKF